MGSWCLGPAANGANGANEREWGRVRLTFCALQSKVQNVSLTPDSDSADPGLRTGLWRRWGLVYPLLLPFCGTRSQLEQHTDWYDDAAAEIVRAKGQASPRIVDEFRQRVLVDHDWQYAETFLAEVRRSRSAQSDQ
jgi:hypothetical protein